MVRDIYDLYIYLFLVYHPFEERQLLITEAETITIATCPGGRGLQEDFHSR